MKYLALVLLAACAPQPCPTVFLPKPVEVPDQAPVARVVPERLKAPLPKEVLESRIRRECEGRYGRSLTMSAFCACLAGAVSDNVRVLGIVTYQDFHERVEETLPTPNQIRACVP